MSGATEEVTAKRIVLTSQGALQTLVVARDYARFRGWEVCIAVVDGAGTLMAYGRVGDPMPISTMLAQEKARTAAHLRCSSSALEERLAGGDLSILSAAGVIASAGAHPLISNGVVVGAIGVSGVTAEQDAEIAAAGAAWLRDAALPLERDRT